MLWTFLIVLSALIIAVVGCAVLQPSCERDEATDELDAQPRRMPR